MIIDGEAIFKGKRYVYKNYGTNRLLIILNTHNQGDRYFGFSGLTKSPKSDLLFLTDPTNRYYLDDDFGGGYIELIKIIAERYDSSCVCIFGTSMAGYAALHFGSILGLHIIASNPQLDLNLTYRLSWENLRNSIDKMDARPHIKELIKDTNPRSVFLIHGEHRLDVANADVFNQINFGECTIIKKRVISMEHGFFIHDLDNIFFIQDMLMNLKDSY